ncbi:MAG: DNA mismatch repair endonuclease MutL [Candidatus Bipolaricaulaceae bacterium]
MRIHRLDEALISKIAAGEVVEGPLSVVKELVENALDAHCRQVEVSLAGGGIERVEVGDDGIGMTPGELRLAVERHTTSKLQRAADLAQIKTLGFRGEALAAICAVARVRLVSRPRGADEGYELVVAGGRVVGGRPAPRPEGTTVEVSELFHDVPARRRFLRSPIAEGRRALVVLRRLALGHPRVGFAVESGGRQAIAAPAVSGPLARIRQLYGDELAARLVPVEIDEGAYRLQGLFAPPEWARPTRVDQHVFLCGRPVRPGPLGTAVQQAYRRYLGRGQHPMFFVYLEVDPQLVDVNVHPRKEEVRFRVQAAVFDLMQRAAMRALGRQGAPRPPAVGEPPPPRPAAGAESPRLLAAGPSAHPQWRVLGQVHRAYLVVEDEAGVELVDQHAAHERVLFEKWRDGEEVTVQELLVPVQVELPVDRADVLRRALPRLRRLGVELEPFGDRAFLLRGWPAPLAGRQTRLGFRDPLAAVAEVLAGGEPPTWELWREVACAAAVKAGEELSAAEQQSLVAAWKGTQEPGRCPHGRPVAWRIPWGELATRMGR